MADTSEIAFNRPKTAREEAAAAERSKREAEMAELRRLRTEQTQRQNSTQQSSAADVARKKREDEIEELRRLKAGENEEFRKKLSMQGGSLTTDMTEWERTQRGAHEKDRKNKMEAQSGLHGYGGYNHMKTAAELDKAAWSEAQRAQMAAMGQLSLDGDTDHYNDPVSQAGEASAKERPAPGKLSINQPAAEASSAKGRPAPGKLSINQPATKEEAPVEPQKASKPQGNVFNQGSHGKFPAPSPQASASVPKEASFAEEGASSSLPAQAAPAAAPEPEEEPATPPEIRSVPTFTRVDIKFSFGLIVRSSAADGFESENLRDNETLRKCMEGTSKILQDKMPLPPDIVKFEASSTLSSDMEFPEAYYDPTLEPNVISIEEDKKNEVSKGKRTAKGNKRTLVKASFPVFLRDEEMDDEGQKMSARMLKETKTTVFKALRAAVSGGSFLR